MNNWRVTVLLRHRERMQRIADAWVAELSSNTYVFPSKTYWWPW